MGSKLQMLAGWLRKSGFFSSIIYLRHLTHPSVLTVLNYHGLGEVREGYLFDSDVVDATEENLERQLDYLAKHFSIIGLDMFLDALNGGRSLPSRSLMITFDDGYRSNFEIALPALSRRDLKGVFFVATDYIEQRRVFWWDRINYLVKSSKQHELCLKYPRSIQLRLGQDRKESVETLLDVVKKQPGLDLERFLDEIVEITQVEWNRRLEQELADQLIMTWDQVRAIRDAGMDVQSHTRGHRVLQTLELETLREELEGSRRDLEDKLGQPVRTVAYPVGWPVAWEPSLREALVASGYEAGFTCGSGLNLSWRSMDRFDVRRLVVGRLTSFDVFCAQLVFPFLSYRIS